jgi:hypothetical protein
VGSRNPVLQAIAEPKIRKLEEACRTSNGHPKTKRIPAQMLEGEPGPGQKTGK